MPPRQPLKLGTTGRTPARKARKALDFAQLTAEVAMANQPAPAKPVARPGFSPYPDLTMALEMLNKRLQHVTPGERHTLITKWLTQLTKIQAEMQKLYRLEQLSQKLRTPAN
jgi:hypothetical protein